MLGALMHRASSPSSSLGAILNGYSKMEETPKQNFERSRDISGFSFQGRGVGWISAKLRLEIYLQVKLKNSEESPMNLDKTSEKRRTTLRGVQSHSTLYFFIQQCT